MVNQSKSTRKQNLTGNRVHAPTDETYKDTLAEKLAQRIHDAGRWDMIDVESITRSYPGVWGMTCNKVRDMRKKEVAIERTLRAQCDRREQERFDALRHPTSFAG